MSSCVCRVSHHRTTVARSNFLPGSNSGSKTVSKAVIIKLLLVTRYRYLVRTVQYSTRVPILQYSNQLLFNRRTRPAASHFLSYIPCLHL